MSLDERIYREGRGCMRLPAARLALALPLAFLLVLGALRA